MGSQYVWCIPTNSYIHQVYRNAQIHPQNFRRGVRAHCGTRFCMLNAPSSTIPQFDTQAECNVFCTPPSYACNSLVGVCEVLGYYVDVPISQEVCESTCSITNNTPVPINFCDKTNPACMQEFTHRFVVDTIMKDKVSIHAFYTMGVFKVPDGIYTVQFDIGYDLSIEGSGTDMLVPGLMLLESSPITKTVPNLEILGNITVKSHSPDVKIVKDSNMVKGFPGTVPVTPWQWVSAGNNVASLSTTASVTVTPGKTYIVCAYLGVAKSLDVVLNFDRYANSIRFI